MLFDPLGFAVLFVLPIKRLLQNMAKDQVEWDNELSPTTVSQWQRRKEDGQSLENFDISRCIMPATATKVKVEIHTFCNAFWYTYGTTSYLLVKNVYGQVHCSLLMAKSRLSPIKPTSIPRLELVGAVFATKLYNIYMKEITLPIERSMFWCKSTIVLAYIKSTNKRCTVFISDRLGTIWATSQPDLWNYMNTGANPADIASRGLTAAELMSSTAWLHGPEFLRQANYMNAFINNSIPNVEMDSEDMKEKWVNAIDQTATNTLLPANIQSNLDTLVNHYSD